MQSYGKFLGVLIGVGAELLLWRQATEKFEARTRQLADSKHGNFDSIVSYNCRPRRR